MFAYLFKISKIKTKMIGMQVRAFLLNMISQNALKCFVQNMCDCMISGNIHSSFNIYFCCKFFVTDLSFLQFTEMDKLVCIFLNITNYYLTIIIEDFSTIGNLPTGFSVERSFIQHNFNFIFF